MPYRPAPLRQNELTRYAKALRSAGVENWRMEIEPSGKVVIIAGAATVDAQANPCDRLLK
jgi:hypothetical protein